jgi:predicted ATP-dependent protease
VLILTGYLSNTFSQDEALSMSGRVVFEQSYQGVEGDSASSAELYALLSALSETPLAQGIAVTGSVNQYGEIQAVGGINEKIEGFFDVCSLGGLSGNQGVIIPESNVQNLMLREDVVDAVERGDFHVWSVSGVKEGIELLTGQTAGAFAEDSRSYPEDSIFGAVSRTLSRFAQTLKKQGNHEAEENERESSD